MLRAAGGMQYLSYSLTCSDKNHSSKKKASYIRQLTRWSNSKQKSNTDKFIVLSQIGYKSGIYLILEYMRTLKNRHCPTTLLNSPVTTREYSFTNL